MNTNAYALFASHVVGNPGRIALETADGDRLSYADLDRNAARLAGRIAALGARPGDRVAAQMDKSPWALALYLACLRGGFAFLPLNTAYRPAELEHFITDARPRLVVCGQAQQPALAPLCTAHGVAHLCTLEADGSGSLAAASGDELPISDCGGAHPAALLYTSGTTGRPKGAVISHDNLAANARDLMQAWEWRSDDVLIHALPLFHIHGLFVACHCTLFGGSSMLFLPRFDAGAVIASLPRATVLMGVPTFYTRLLAHPGLTAKACAHMRLFISGSAPLTEQTFNEFRQRTGHAILERFGMTETGMNASNPVHGERRPGTVGLALPQVRLRITGADGRELAAGEVGEIEVSGPNVFSGYWHRPEANAECFTADGWFHTGDLGRIDADGYLAIVGRAKDLIISGGYNVYPKEIERCIDDLEGVAESAVIGLPDPDFGEAVTAVVVVRPGAAGLSESGVVAALRGQLANYKVPKRVVFVPELPRNAMGKVQKNELRARLAPA